VIDIAPETIAARLEIVHEHPRRLVSRLRSESCVVRWRDRCGRRRNSSS